MKKQLYFNGKLVKTVPKTAKLVRVVNAEYYEDEAYTKQQYSNAIDYFAKQAEYREELNQRHG